MPFQESTGHSPRQERGGKAYGQLGCLLELVLELLLELLLELDSVF